MLNKQHFPNHLIDEIDGDTEDNYFSPVLSDVFNHISNPVNILDVGCGNGLFTAATKKTINCQLIGVDGNQYALENAMLRGFDKVFLVDDLSNDNLHLPSCSIDLTICKDVLEHLLYPDWLMGEMARVTKNGGYVLLHVPNHFPIMGRIRLLFHNSIDPFGFFPSSERWNFPHIRFYNKDSINRLARNYDLHLDLDLSWHFFQHESIVKYFPRIAQWFGNRYTDSMSGGITMLFKKII